MNKSLVKPVAIGALLLACCLGVGSCVVSRPYSEGYRDGLVTKFSHKGFLRKSWEGDLTSGGRASTVAVVWKFTASDPDVVKELQGLSPGQLVRLHYEEYLWTTGGETNYRVTKVEKLRE